MVERLLGGQWINVARALLQEEICGAKFVFKIFFKYLSPVDVSGPSLSIASRFALGAIRLTEEAQEEQVPPERGYNVLRNEVPLQFEKPEVAIDQFFVSLLFHPLLLGSEEKRVFEQRGLDQAAEAGVKELGPAR